jgi:glycerol transport system ATP-binding protein
MYEGEVVQMGTPEDLFERPAHTFVGYFIGSPGMNVAPVQVEGSRARLGQQDVRLASAYPDLAKGARIELGIRPEYVRVGADVSGIPGRVLKVDDIGRYRVVRVDIDGNVFNAIAGEGARIEGDVTNVALDPANIHIYADSRRVDATSAVTGGANP